MILTIDIGNTCSKYAVYQGDTIVETAHFDAHTDHLREVVKKYPSMTRAIISSVNGQVDLVEESLRGSGVSLLVLDSSTPVPFRYSSEGGSIGADRIALVAAARSLAPDQNVLVIDIGTCITYDIMTAEGVQYCGPISPGLRLRAAAMHQLTHLLPLLTDFNAPTPLLCFTTEECLTTGTVRAVSYEIQGFIDDYRQRYDNLKVFISGGDKNLFEKSLKFCTFAKLNFVFEGLRFILEHNESKDVER